MTFGSLEFSLASDSPELVAPPTARAIREVGLSDALVAEIDPALSDTAAFCDRYGVGMDISANCVIVEANRGEHTKYAACMILATERIDVNGTVRRFLEARKISLAPMEQAVTLTGMEYGGITPIGLPADWPILVDSKVATTGKVIIGGGVRKSKLLVPGALLGMLPNAVVLDIAKAG